MCNPFPDVGVGLPVPIPTLPSPFTINIEVVDDFKFIKLKAELQVLSVIPSITVPQKVEHWL